MGRKRFFKKRHGQKHQETDGKSNGEPSKEVYFFSWGRNSNKKKKEEHGHKHQETDENSDGRPSRPVYFFTSGEKIKNKQKHQESDGKPLENPSSKFTVPLGKKTL